MFSVNRSGLVAALCLAMAAVAAPSAWAQYTGPSDQKVPRTVAEVVKSGVDDQQVRLEGRIVRQVGN